MRARVPRRGIVVLLALALVLVVLAGCGGGDKAATTAAPAATLPAGLTAEGLVKESEAKMATVKSASFTGDLALQVQGDTEKMTDPTAKALLSQGVTVHAEGAAAASPSAADMTVNLGIAGQTLEFGLKGKGPRAWISYQGTWYKLDPKTAKSLDKQSKAGGGPAGSLKSLGIDPAAWGATYEFVGTEQLEGVEVYHVKAAADPAKVAASLAQAAKDPSVKKQLGEAGGELGALGQGLTLDAKQIEELGKMLKGASVDSWIGVDDRYTYKTQFSAAMDTSGQEGAQGLTGVTLKGAMTMSAFDEPVEVTPPADAQSFDKFMTQLFGGMFGGGSGLTS